ncbi:MAG: 30S ribosomal protein S16 [Acidobacteriota bacterium]
MHYNPQALTLSEVHVLLAIRLTRQGAKKRPFYRVVVADKSAKRDGRFVEIVGHYNPCREPIELKLNHERISYWIGKGAQPSDTVRNLIRKSEKQSVVVEAEPAA